MVVKRRPYNFRAILGAYMISGIVIAFLIHFIVLSSPRYNWIFPQTNGGIVTGSGQTQVNPAPGAK
jgi:enoyl-CoA hydratase/carnithine racemase